MKQENNNIVSREKSFKISTLLQSSKTPLQDIASRPINFLSVLTRIKNLKTMRSEEGKIGYIIGWMVGIPIPLLLLVFFIRGCN